MATMPRRYSSTDLVCTRTDMGGPSATNTAQDGAAGILYAVERGLAGDTGRYFKAGHEADFTTGAAVVSAGAANESTAKQGAAAAGASGGSGGSGVAKPAAPAAVTRTAEEPSGSGVDGA